jgi:hypothetical protein
MAETKIKSGDALRIPKPKKKLGLSVPPPLRMPHEDLILVDRQDQDEAHTTPVITPAATAVAGPATTPASTPVPTAVNAPAGTAVTTTPHTATTTPVTTPVIEPALIATSRRPRTELPFGRTGETYIDATHRASEQQIYSVMYRETISKGVSERYFGTTELMRKTGIRSDKTVRTAIRGLKEKLSIEMVSFSYGNPLGPRYRIFGPKEILQRRRDAGIEIDPQSKQIITPVITGAPTRVATPEDTRVRGLGESYRGTPAIETPVTPVTFTGHSKYTNEDWTELEENVSSSSKSVAVDDDNDATYLDSIRTLYQQITGNTWTPSDIETAMRGREIPPDIWGIALCFCVDRAPGNRFQRLAYVFEEARTHLEGMKQFSSEAVKAILQHNLRTLERVRASGAWIRPESESPKSD